MAAMRPLAPCVHDVPDCDMIRHATLTRAHGPSSKKPEAGGRVEQVGDRYPADGARRLPGKLDDTPGQWTHAPMILS